jgi:cation:H+ antiporter
MSFLSFESYSLGINALIFVIAAALIWIAGTTLERYADAISVRTGLGQAFTGVLLLSTATSLPEVATTITAVALLNNPTLAVYNLLGGVAMQTAILAIADRAQRQPGALTFFQPRFVLLMQGVGLLLLLQLAVAGVAAQGWPKIFSISLWPIAIFIGYLAILYATYRYRGQPRWTPTKGGDAPMGSNRSQDRRAEESARDGERLSFRSTPALWSIFCGLSLVVLVAGWAVAQSADVLAEQTGMGDAFLGATLLALATSLPEVSTTIAASRQGRYSMAISNIFGSNGFDVSLLCLAELLYTRGTIMAHAEGSVVFVAAIGAIMTSIYLWGMLERRDQTFLKVGLDSATAVIVYLGGMTVLYFLG